MTAATSARALSAAVVCALAAVGCLARSYPAIDRFVLDAPPAPAAAVRPVGVLRVGRVSVSPLYDKPDFVYRTGTSRYVEDFYNQFFVPPGVLVDRVTTEWMSESGLFHRVLAADERGTADWILDGRVVELYGDVRDKNAPRAVLTVEYTLLMQKNPRPTIRFSKRYAAAAPVPDHTAARMVAAWNRCLAEVLAQLAGDLRNEFRPTAAPASRERS